MYPDSKPDLYFDTNGVCSACLAFDARANKNWEEWERKFHDLMKNNKRHPVYDCIIPVSGGKDSHYQVIKVLELGYNPLCICARTDDLSELGRKNLDNIGELGVDLIEVNTNRQVRKRIAKYALETVGDISWGEHVTIFTIPFNLSFELGIPLIIYGENPQNEYGAGPIGTEKEYILGYEWLQEFGGLNGLRVSDIPEEIAREKDLYQYKMHIQKCAPRGFEQEISNPQAIFLGQFFEWDGEKNAQIASKHGFDMCKHYVEGTGSTFENLDNYQTGIHDYFKYIKFGFSRATDIACNRIRRGKMSRDQAKLFILKHDGNQWAHYLSRPTRNIVEAINLDIEFYMEIVKEYTNKELFDITDVGVIPKTSLIEGIKNA